MELDQLILINTNLEIIQSKIDDQEVLLSDQQVILNNYNIDKIIDYQFFSINLLLVIVFLTFLSLVIRGQRSWKL